ncbi:hypothetical protein SAMN02745691_02099 [Parasporobacterium paucivorans DSM 15970]|uniref:Uncharacterized protein n=1 Tax=Parasporobacterium paucivorans DSM 15970 TaxID=1122934 RepID=A0A1M6JZI9_9FIRM|nr:hypothetical protein SAMN02745691_02099 [Parasporobacterium paucivorans DSM 15970]
MQCCRISAKVVTNRTLCFVVPKVITIGTVSRGETMLTEYIKKFLDVCDEANAEYLCR